MSKTRLKRISIYKRERLIENSIYVTKLTINVIKVDMRLNVLLNERLLQFGVF